MDYEKKYNEAMLRADEAVQKGCLDKNIFDIIFPSEESEDERIRRELIEYLRGDLDDITTDDTDRWIAYLEKQKVNTEGDFARGYDCGYECCLHSHGAEWLEKQKEQKPNIEICPHSTKSKSYKETGYPSVLEQKPVEWSEEDEMTYNDPCIIESRI